MTATMSAPEGGASASLIGDRNPGMLVVVIPDCLKGVKTLVGGMYWHRCGEMPSGVDRFRLLGGRYWCQIRGGVC
jgi:hypothetical protein